MKFIVCTDIIPLKKNDVALTEVRDVLNSIYTVFNSTPGVYTKEEVEEKIANACGWCESVSEESIYEGECFTIKAREEYSTFYTLRKGKYPEEIYSDETDKPVKFTSFEEAYDKMARIYINSLEASYDNPSGLPLRYGIWKTTCYDGNQMTQPVWVA